MINTKLKEVKQHPYLGVEPSNDLSWRIHINNTAGKAIRVLHFPRRPCIIVLGTSRTLPKLLTSDQCWVCWCCAIWYLQPGTDTKMRCQLCHREISNIWQCDRHDHWTEQEYTPAVLFRGKANHDVESSSKGQIAVHIPDHIHRTTAHVQSRGHHPHTYINVSCKTDSYKYSFYPKTIHCWNLLPENIVMAESTDSF